MKSRRHAKILEIISHTDTVTQKELIDKLKESGFHVTQATVSRDIKELGIIKAPRPEHGYKYVLPEKLSGTLSKHLSIFSQSVISIQYALHTVVAKTLPGMAQAAAAAIDNIAGNEFIGSIAGDDTILVVTQSESHAKALAEKFEAMQAGTIK